MMALINTRNVHRSNMLMGFPYGRDFVYDEMVLTGPGEKGEANAKKVMALNSEKTGPSAPKPGEGPSKEERENGRYDLLYLAVASDGRMVRAGIKGDRDPGYGSTSKMISECAICLLRDGAAPVALAQWLVAQGLGATRITVLEALGGPRERMRQARAEGFALDCTAPVAVALDGTGLPPGSGLPRGFGLPDDAFAHDGQITRRAVRAVTLAHLAPRPGELLWDIGGGSGSVSVEWCLNGGHAVTLEPRPDRLANIVANIEAFGLTGRMRAVAGIAPEALAGLPAPDAIFVGGGASAALIDALPPARLVVNAVTLETEALVAALHAARGGSLTRLSVEEAAPLGRMRGWTPARSVTIWSGV